MARHDVQAAMISYPIGDRRVEFNIVSPPDWTVDGTNYFYEPEVVNVISKVVRKDDFVIDAGANLGFFTMILSRLVGDKGLVMAFEPDTKIYRELVENVEANNFMNVMCSDTALWNSDCEKEFWVYPKSGYSSFVPYDESTPCLVRARKLDTLLQAFPPPRFMKLDCEGSEQWILYGTEQTLRRGVHCVVVELNYEMMDDFGFSKTAVREFMTALGYHMFIISVRDPVTDEYKLVRVEPDQELIIRCKDEDRARVVNVMFSRSLDPLATGEIGHG